MWCVYILTCSDGTYYVGSTLDIEKRLYAHNNLKSGAHYTKIRRPVVLCYFEPCENLSVARKREAELKKLSREMKHTLITASKGCYTISLSRTKHTKTMAKGNNSRKKEAKKPKKAKK
jgi:putative endonuclease